jgi:hypothetical protein
MKRSKQKHQECNLERIFDPPLRAPARAGQLMRTKKCLAAHAGNQRAVTDFKITKE